MLKSINKHHYNNDDDSFIDENYDFVIIGGGTAGLVLASRLTENEEFNVLLLEAGENEENLELVRNLDLWMEQKYTHLRWQIFKKKDETVTHNDLEIPVAKMLGGGTSANAGGYERGNAEEWNRMAKITGDKSWRMENLNKYFKRIERSYGMENNLYKTGQTPLYFGKHSNLSETWYNVSEEMDLPITVGYTDPDKTYGLGFEPVTELNGQRQSTVQTYYHSIAGSTLRVLKNAQVSNLVIKEKRGKSCISAVKFFYKGKCYKIKPEKEVILSAGAILTPFILKQSYLPRKIKGLGENLYDSASFAMIFSNNIESENIIRDVKPTAMLSTDGVNSDTFIIVNTIPGLFIVVVFAMLSDPKGYVDKYDDNPYTMPKVEYDLLDGEDDMVKMIKRIEMVRELMGTDAMSIYQPQELEPGVDTDLEAFIRDNITQAGHFVGTARMGRDNDDKSVVDTRFNVKKIDGLRIVDASIIPTKQDMGTMAATLVVAERASDIIKKDYGLDSDSDNDTDTDTDSEHDHY